MTWRRVWFEYWQYYDLMCTPKYMPLNDDILWHVFQRVIIHRQRTVAMLANWTGVSSLHNSINCFPGHSTWKTMPFCDTVIINSMTPVHYLWCTICYMKICAWSIHIVWEIVQWHVLLLPWHWCWLTYHQSQGEIGAQIMISWSWNGKMFFCCFLQKCNKVENLGTVHLLLKSKAYTF